MNHSSFARIFKIDRLLRFNQFESIESVAKILDVSRRSVERDLEKMRYELGADIVYDRRHRRFKYVGNPVTLPAQWLDKNEIAIMLVAEKALKGYTGTSFSPNIHPAFNHFLNPVRGNEDVMEHIKELCNSISFYKSSYSAKESSEDFNTVLSAIIQRKRIRAKYNSGGRGEISQRDIEPYAFINYDGIWEITGRCLRSRRIKTFALNRLSDIVIVDKFFEIPDDFDIIKCTIHRFEFLKHTPFETIKLKIAPGSAEFVKERIWHPSQKIRNCKDGSVIVTFNCNITEFFIMWVMQILKDVTILKSETLKKELKNRVDSFLELNYPAT